ncbi:hypothetical protein [Curvivirga sp.]|uniref:hypothetical protein n=1 Tax=Curvivirga sp. TaxID=2856848 RepID=UPI003B5C898D
MFRLFNAIIPALILVACQTTLDPAKVALIPTKDSFFEKQYESFTSESTPINYPISVLQKSHLPTKAKLDVFSIINVSTSIKTNQAFNLQGDLTRTRTENTIIDTYGFYELYGKTNDTLFRATKDTPLKIKYQEELESKKFTSEKNILLLPFAHTNSLLSNLTTGSTIKISDLKFKEDERFTLDLQQTLTVVGSVKFKRKEAILFELNGEGYQFLLNLGHRHPVTQTGFMILDQTSGQILYYISHIANTDSSKMWYWEMHSQLENFVNYTP